MNLSNVYSLKKAIKASMVAFILIFSKNIFANELNYFPIQGYLALGPYYSENFLEACNMHRVGQIEPFLGDSEIVAEYITYEDGPLRPMCNWDVLHQGSPTAQRGGTLPSIVCQKPGTYDNLPDPFAHIMVPVRDDSGADIDRVCACQSPTIFNPDSQWCELGAVGEETGEENGEETETVGASNESSNSGCDPEDAQNFCHIINPGILMLLLD